jgi:hypothetical protein
MIGLGAVIPFWGGAVDGDSEGGNVGCVGRDGHEAGEDASFRGGRILDGGAAFGEKALDDRVVLKGISLGCAQGSGRYLGVELELNHISRLGVDLLGAKLEFATLAKSNDVQRLSASHAAESKDRSHEWKLHLRRVLISREWRSFRSNTEVKDRVKNESAKRREEETSPWKMC